MTVLVLALACCGALLVALSFRPPRADRLAPLVFAATWLTGELAPAGLCVYAGVWAGLLATGVTKGALWWWVLGMSALACAGLAVHIAMSFGARRIMVRAARDALGDAAGPERRSLRTPRPGFVARCAGVLRIVAAVPVRPPSVRRVKDIDYAGDGLRRHRLDILVRRRPPRSLPGDPRPAPVLVYIHGGAWVVGDKTQQGRPLLHTAARRGFVCVSITYRLSPKATWPDHVVDCKHAIAWVKAHIAEFGGDPDFVALAGGSAGGHLAALCGLSAGDPSLQPGFEDADTSVAACIPLYGVYDFTNASGTQLSTLVGFLARYVMKTGLSSDRARWEAASPLHRVRRDSPPFLILHGTNDSLVPVAGATRFADALRRVSKAPVAIALLPVAQHAFDIVWSIRASAAVDAILAFCEGIHTAGLAGRAERDRAAPDRL